MTFLECDDGFDLILAGRTILSHRTHAPLMAVGRGHPDVRMKRGHFHIEDHVEDRLPLTEARVEASAVSLGRDGKDIIRIAVSSDQGKTTLHFTCCDPSLNRFWLCVVAERDEYVWGGGEQFSYFNLRGRLFPFWTSEPGVGRDKSTYITQLADSEGGFGGDYFTTNFPQPTYLSSRRYALHVGTTAWSAFDFREAMHHEIQCWDLPETIEIWTRDGFADLVSALSDRFGRQPPLPEWLLKGAVVGLKDGANSLVRLNKYLAAGAAVSGLWCEDWVGVRQTEFGTRLFWDWKWNPKRYPALDEEIMALRERGIRFLGYVNPYLCTDGSLYPEAESRGFLVRLPDCDKPYLQDFGEFTCGMVDFTNPDASRWFSDEIIGHNMLDFGLSGWMADFAEYLPPDVCLASGLPGMLAHNAWPVLWAKVNADAVAARGKIGESVFFMRSGFTGAQGYCPLLWAGDQSVDFTRHDGLPSVICAALSSGILGSAYHHSDIGGYTSLFGNLRTPELIQRWAEMAAFTSMMRSHEGNRPRDNMQIDDDPLVLAHFARMTRIYRHMGPYIRKLSMEASVRGLPLQRAAFLHFDDPKTYGLQNQYLFGSDLLVAPILSAGVNSGAAYLPAGARWIHVWSGVEFEGGQEVEVDAPLGEPPVFYRAGSPHTDLFRALKNL